MRVLSVSLGHGFPWADVADLGAKVLVVTDGDAGQGRERSRPRSGASCGRSAAGPRRRCSATSGGRARARDARAGRSCSPTPPTTPAAAPRAMPPSCSGACSSRASARRRSGPSGIPSRSASASSRAPVAGCGCGSAARSGRSPAIRSTSRRRSCISPRAPGSASRAAGPSSATSPRSAVDGVELLLDATRTQAFDPALFTDHGIGLDDKKLVVVKWAQHFRAGSAPVAKEVLWLDGPGRADPGLRAPALHPGAAADLAARSPARLSAAGRALSPAAGAVGNAPAATGLRARPSSQDQWPPATASRSAPRPATGCVERTSRSKAQSR